ncbi:Acetolactate synthase, catabolic [Posidoniimonas polymericola]|uniref:Acetolactate synthase, catabolic n=1 Tax=Posidoniimonas polymericola TaxID=2528002 RepID=A0A5C5YSP6_9BACT|nr:acetolactate synthase large subunit [Posidoniimonas polymericola]TWT77896.1 Acetolactate synthase, catabolic [Posidoniimonas polymericola]
MKASDLFVRALEAEGVEYIFGIPGEENLDLLDSLSRSSIRLIITRHEQAAGFMAATYGRLTGKAGVCLSTLGPGATNFVTAAAYAQLGAMPMLMITGQKPIKSSKQGHFQIIDTVDMMRPITKYTKQIVSGDNIPSRVREAFRLAEEERPGAVHLELPEDIARETTSEPVMPASAARRPVAEEKSIQQAIELIEEAERPLILIGAAANRKLTCRAIRRFVQQTGIPFFATQMGKGVGDETDPLCLGNAALSSGDFLHQAIDAADLIVNIGHNVVEKPPFFMTPGGVRVVHVNFTSAEVDPVYFPQVEVVGDIAHSVWRMGNEVRPRDDWDFTPFFNARDAEQRHIAPYLTDDRFPVSPIRLVHEVQSVMPDDGMLALDNGVYKIWFARNYKARQPNTVLLDNALASMGAGLPSAMAAHLVHPDRKVMAICGDGGFMMNAQELETAVRLKMNLTIVILNDSAYGMIKWKQADMGFADFGLDFSNPDWVKFAECHGARGHRVDSIDQLGPILQSAGDQPGVDLIDVPVDYSVNDVVLNKEIKELAAV